MDPADPAFQKPEKPIGPVYLEEAVKRVRGEHPDWHLVEETSGRWRRVVPSPAPKTFTQIEPIRILVDQGVIVVCAGGGGIPVVRDAQGQLEGIEAVIDKDLAAGLLARELEADAFLMLTDVEAVYLNWGTPEQQPLRKVSPQQLAGMSFAAGSMGPKVQAARNFASAPGRIAGIGRLEDARAILEGRTGTLVCQDP